jgi:pyruvate dehydrogenase E1 component alpha subunit
MADPIHGHYRTKDELEEQKALDPIQRLEHALQEADLLDGDLLTTMREEIDAEVDDAVRFADESPDPDGAELFTDVTRD